MGNIPHSKERISSHVKSRSRRGQCLAQNIPEIRNVSEGKSKFKKKHQKHNYVQKTHSLPEPILSQLLNRSKQLY